MNSRHEWVQIRCPHCNKLMDADLSKNDVIKRLKRVDKSLAAQLSASMQENAKLQKQIRELQDGLSEGN